MKRLKSIFCLAFLILCGTILFTGCNESPSDNTPTSYVVTFNSCGGREIQSQNVEKGQTISKPMPIRDGYDFMGWYIDSNYSDKFDFNTKIENNITLYAKWSNDYSELYNFELTNDYSFYGITGYNGESINITLPRLYNGLRVISVNSNAFKDNKSIETVTLPNTIELIYSSAFQNCSNLKTIEIPNSVHSIGENAFNSCTSLDNLHIPSSVETIGMNAFQNCAGLRNLTLQDGIKTIEAMAFDGCISLQNLVLPNSITSVGGMAFRHCDSLISATISTGMSEIPNTMFQCCGSLKSLILPENITSIGNSAMSYCYSLEDIQILGDITFFGNSAFYDCHNIKSIYFASTTFGDYQSGRDNYIFYNAGISNTGITLTLSANAVLPTGIFMPYQNSNIPNITAVAFENGYVSIDSAEFNRMPYLSSITVPDTVRYIAKGIFDETPWYDAQSNGVVYIDNIVYGYKGNVATNVVIPDKVVAFGNAIFSEISGNLSNLTLPFIGMSKDATGKNALFGSIFGEIENENSVAINQKYSYNENITFYIPKTLKNITITDITQVSYGAFSGCGNLENIDLSHCVNLTSIGDLSFYQCANLNSVVLPNNLLIIGGSAFRECINLTTIEIPNSVYELGSHAFHGCSKLSSITLSKNITILYIYSFYDCEALKSIIIHENITILDIYSFYNCEGLETVIIESANIYNTITTSSYDYLLAYVTTIKVLKSIVDNEENSNVSLNSKYYDKTEDGDYYVYTKKQ